MNKGLKWCLMSAMFLAAGCAYLISSPSNSSIAADSASPASVAKSSEAQSIGAAPTEDLLAGRVRRHNRRVYRRTV